MKILAKNFSKKLYNSAKWKKIRNYILTRDFYMCKICGEINCDTVHHIIELTPININDANITLNPDNLITVCKQCHDEIHSRNYRPDKARYTFDADGNIIEVEQQDTAKTRKEYNAEQRAAIVRYQARLKG